MPETPGPPGGSGVRGFPKNDVFSEGNWSVLELSAFRFRKIHYLVRATRPHLSSSENPLLFSGSNSAARKIPGNPVFSERDLAALTFPGTSNPGTPRRVFRKVAYLVRATRLHLSFPENSYLVKATRPHLSPAGPGPRSRGPYLVRASPGNAYIVRVSLPDSRRALWISI